MDPSAENYPYRSEVLIFQADPQVELMETVYGVIDTRLSWDGASAKPWKLS